MIRNIGKFFYHKIHKSGSRWYPFLTVYYLTYACTFRCPYCSDGHQIPYYQLEFEEPSKENALNIIGSIRNYTDSLALTGGEPLEHKNLNEILSVLHTFKFREIILTTNGFNLDQLAEEGLNNLTNLVVSIDTMEVSKADKIYGLGSGTFQKILSNLDQLRYLNPKHLKVTLSSVITPENIQDLYEVFSFAQENQFEFAAAPQLHGVKPHPHLEDNDDYQQFFDFLIHEKKQGANIFNTPLYLKYLRDLENFACHPFTMLIISPEGNVFYPCLEMGHNAGNITTNQPLHQFKKQGEAAYGPQPKCPNQCHSACALSFSLLFEKTTRYLVEYLLY